MPGLDDLLSAHRPDAASLQSLLGVFDPYNTPLTPEEEAQFQVWKAQYAPHDSGVDYDLRGAFKAGVVPDPETHHMPDTFKKPNHPTFSVESRYAKDRPELAGRWEGTGRNAKYIPASRQP